MLEFAHRAEVARAVDVELAPEGFVVGAVEVVLEAL